MRPTIRIDVAEANKALAKVMKNLEQGIQKDVMVKVSMDTHRNLVKTTPRKTGRARAGWVPTVDSPPSERKPAEGSSSYAEPSFNVAGQIKFNSVVNLSNNVEYIVPLDEGHSVTQAPNGIVGPVMAALTAQLTVVANSQSRRRIP